MDKSTMSMAMFNSYVTNYQRVLWIFMAILWIFMDIYGYVIIQPISFEPRARSCPLCPAPQGDVIRESKVQRCVAGADCQGSFYLALEIRDIDGGVT